VIFDRLLLIDDWGTNNQEYRNSERGGISYIVVVDKISQLYYNCKLVLAALCVRSKSKKVTGKESASQAIEDIKQTKYSETGNE